MNQSYIDSFFDDEGTFNGNGVTQSKSSYLHPLSVCVIQSHLRDKHNANLPIIMVVDILQCIIGLIPLESILSLYRTSKRLSFSIHEILERMPIRSIILSESTLTGLYLHPLQRSLYIPSKPLLRKILVTSIRQVRVRLYKRSLYGQKLYLVLYDVNRMDVCIESHKDIVHIYHNHNKTEKLKINLYLCGTNAQSLFDEYISQNRKIPNYKLSYYPNTFRLYSDVDNVQFNVYDNYNLLPEFEGINLI
jgi:hypothetical protein